jgi:hypothetical protein
MASDSPPERSRVVAFEQLSDGLWSVGSGLKPSRAAGPRLRSAPYDGVEQVRNGDALRSRGRHEPVKDIGSCGKRHRPADGALARCAALGGSAENTPYDRGADVQARCDGLRIEASRRKLANAPGDLQVKLLTA